MNRAHMLEPNALLDVEIRHLRLLVAIVEEGSITRAGARLHLTQSALSHQLSDLEDRLATQIFSRTKSGLVLTQSGHQILKVAREVLGRLEIARRELVVGAQQTTGVLRLTTECLTCYHWLPQVMRRLHSKYPDVQVQVDVNATSRPLQALQEGRIDLALAYTPGRRAALVNKPLFNDELVAVLAPNHPLAKRPYLQPGDFTDQAAILYSKSRKDMLIYKKFFVSGKVEPKKILTVQLTEAMIELAKAGLGIAILTRWSVEPEVRAGRLLALPLGREGLHRSWSAVYRKQRTTPTYLVEFIQLMKAAFPAGPAMPPFLGA
jgi:LysR family transcriptional regulator for metE and metH